MKLTIQGEVMAGTILQQTFVVEYIVNHQMCDDCRRVEAKDTWNASVSNSPAILMILIHKSGHYYRFKWDRRRHNVKLFTFWNRLCSSITQLRIALESKPIRTKQVWWLSWFTTGFRIIPSPVVLHNYEFSTKFFLLRLSDCPNKLWTAKNRESLLTF